MRHALLVRPLSPVAEARRRTQLETLPGKVALMDALLKQDHKAVARRSTASSARLRLRRKAQQDLAAQIIEELVAAAWPSDSG